MQHSYLSICLCINEGSWTFIYNSREYGTSIVGGLIVIRYGAFHVITNNIFTFFCIHLQFICKGTYTDHKLESSSLSTYFCILLF